MQGPFRLLETSGSEVPESAGLVDREKKEEKRMKENMVGFLTNFRRVSLWFCQVSTTFHATRQF